jgi:hypothetical protein
MPTKMVNTATLVRGKVYTLRHPDNKPQSPRDSLRFVKGVPLIIEEPHILRLLENLTDDVTDGDGEVFAKRLFRIDRNVPAPESSGDDYQEDTRVRSSRVTRNTKELEPAGKPVKTIPRRR